MTVNTSDSQKQIKRQRIYFVVVTLIIALCALASLLCLDAFNSEMYSGAWHNIHRLLAEFFPFDFARASYWWQPALDTLAMAFIGTIFGMICALPLAIAAARNTCIHPDVGFAIRSLLHLLRTIPDLIWAVLLCVAFGAGPFAGMLALFLHSCGALGKNYAEHIEQAASEHYMAIQSTGASALSCIQYGIITPIQPLLLDNSLYRLEVNVRSATVLGFIGAGGIGQELLGALRTLSYQEVSAQLLCLVIIVAGIDSISALIRKRFGPQSPNTAA